MTVLLTGQPLKVDAASQTASKGGGNTIPNFKKKILERNKKNSAALGWLYVPGTNINGVIVQNPPNNNNFYLTHNFNKSPSKNGLFCADRRCELRKGNELSRNTTLYGHSWNENANGILFEQTRRFLNIEFARNHPYIFFSTLEKDMAWEIFAVYYTTVEVPYILPELSWKNFSDVLDVVYASSIYDYGIKIKQSDKILTLSTCTYSVPGNRYLPAGINNKYRYVIMARLVPSGAKLKDTAKISMRTNFMKPDEHPVNW